MKFQNNDDSLIIVKYFDNKVDFGNKEVNGRTGDFDLLIAWVLIKDEISDLKVKSICFGKIASRNWITVKLLSGEGRSYFLTQTVPNDSQVVLQGFKIVMEQLSQLAKVMSKESVTFCF
ncbi:hypothetical protein V6N13_073960 [Hibiscus sabdariffa]